MLHVLKLYPDYSGGSEQARRLSAPHRVTINRKYFKLSEHQHDHHSHEHGEHAHEGHGHSHGLIDPSIKRSKEGLKAVGLSLLVLFIAAGLQTAIYISSHSVALLADLIHNFGDAMTAVPLGIAFLLKSRKLEKWAGYFVVFTIFISAAVALIETIQRFFNPQVPSHLWALAAAGVIGFLGNELAAIIRKRAGRKLDSAALIADGNHASIDGLVSLSVVASAIFIAFGFPLADPIIGLIITLMILRITWQSWTTIRAA